MENEIEVNGVKYIKASSVSAIDKPSGDYVVVRTYSAGVHDGYLVSHEGKVVVLKNTRLQNVAAFLATIAKAPN